jgi:hypothetical protein
MCSGHEVEEKLVGSVPGKLLREATTFVNVIILLYSPQKVLSLPGI